MSKSQPGDEVTFNGKTFVWNYEKHAWGRWQKINGELTFVRMTREEAGEMLEYYNSLPPEQCQDDPIAAGFAFDRAREKWLDKHGMDAAYFDKYDVGDINAAISTIMDVKALMARGDEIEVRYKNCTAFLSCYARQFYISAECDGQEYLWSCSTIDELDNAKVGPYRLKDIVDKWTIETVF